MDFITIKFLFVLCESVSETKGCFHSPFVFCDA